MMGRRSKKGRAAWHRRCRVLRQYFTDGARTKKQKRVAVREARDLECNWVRTRRLTGLRGTNTTHIIQAERALKQAYKHAAKVTTATKKWDCQKVWQEIMNTYGAARAADAHLHAVGSGASASEVRRFQQAMSNKQGLMSRVMKDVDSVGWQCTRKD
jgi:hypothetical protein